MSNQIRLADFFAGIGSTRLGFERAAAKAKVPCSCVCTCEINKNAQKVYLSKFGNSHPILQDITKISESDFDKIPDFDVLLAGFPCQAFSQAGKKQGFEDTRGTLFFNLAKILNAKKPKAFLFENVIGLIRHNKGQTLVRIMDILTELGYVVSYYKINSKNYGVAQNRPRIYIVGFYNCGKGFHPPQQEGVTVTLRDVLEKNPVHPKHYLSLRYLNTLKRHKKHHAGKGQGFGYEVKSSDDIASTIMCGGMGKERNIIFDDRTTDFSSVKTEVNSEHLRFMTPLEWERLQGLPDGWTSAVPDSARMNLLGNTVTVPVIEAIAAKMIPAILSNEPYEGENRLF